MKNTITILMITFFIGFNHGQKKETLDTLHLKEARSFNTKNYKVRASVKVLILPDGTILEKGSTLIIGQPNNSDHKEVENTAENFTQVFGDRFSLMQSTACDDGLEKSWANTKILISEMKIHRKSKDIIVNFTLEKGGTICTGDYGHVLNLQKALDRREIVYGNAPMSKEEAMEKLTEAKRLLELEVLTQEEYNALVAELKPILTGGD